mgnify:FL=1
MAVRWQDNSLLTYDQWLIERLKSIGASEVGAIVYGNAYTSNLEIFYEKIGAPRPRTENIRMFLGKETEETSRKLHQYYSGTEQSVVDNYRSGRKVKETINLNSTAFNSAYPHLSCTPDSEIQPFGKYEGRGKGTLEIKNTTSWYLNSFETGLPTDNVLQICTQLIVPEYEYGELFYFIDNSKFQLHEIERADISNIEETIMLHTIPFWDNVLLARPLYNQLYEAQRNYNMRLVGELQNEIARLEPPAQNTTGYLNFLSKKYTDKMAGMGIMEGNDAQLSIARKHKELGKQIKVLEEDKRKLEIELKLILGDKHTLNFGKNGKISWAESKAGTRTFLNNCK